MGYLKMNQIPVIIRNKEFVLVEHQEDLVEVYFGDDVKNPESEFVLCIHKSYIRNLIDILQKVRIN